MISRITYKIIIILFHLVRYFLVFFFDCLLDSDFFITSVFADSGDEDESSPTENLPKKDKGKGRAVYTEYQEEIEDLPKKAKGKTRAVYTESIDQEELDFEFARKLQEQEKSNFENALEQQNQEKSDFELALELQEQEKSGFENALRLRNEEYHSSLPNKPSDEVESLSEYTLLSTEIHSNDSDDTKSKKLKVKEYENNNRLDSNVKQAEDNDSLKRNYVEESDNENSPAKQRKKR